MRISTRNIGILLRVIVFIPVAIFLVKKKKKDRKKLKDQEIMEEQNNDEN